MRMKRVKPVSRCWVPLLMVLMALGVISVGRAQAEVDRFAEGASRSIEWLQSQASGAGGSVLVAAYTEDGIQLYTVDAAGQQTWVAGLPSSRIGSLVDKSRWRGGTSSSLTLSPDGRLLAFTAHRDGDWSLFVYDLAAGTLIEQSLPTNPKLVWSPDSSALLLTGGTAYPYNDFVYEVGSERLIQLTHTKYGESSFGWLPDSSGLFYQGLYSGCESCETTQALYFVTRDARETWLLAIGAELTRAYSDDSVCWPTWSEPNRRIYFIIGCVAGGNQTNEYLYSVDLAGNVRLEIIGGLNSLYQREFNVWTSNIHPSPLTSDVYLTIASQGGGDEGRNLSNRRILHLSAVDEVERIYEKVMQTDWLSSSRISPEGSAIALLMYGRGTSNGFLEVIDLATGQRMIGPGSTPLDVCDVSWDDETTLFYGVDPTGDCDITRSPQSVWMLDTISGKTQEVTGGLGDNVSIVRQAFVMGRNRPY